MTLNPEELLTWRDPRDQRLLHHRHGILLVIVAMMNLCGRCLLFTPVIQTTTSLPFRFLIALLLILPVPHSIHLIPLLHPLHQIIFPRNLLNHPPLHPIPSIHFEYRVMFTTIPVNLPFLLTHSLFLIFSFLFILPNFY